MVPHFTRVRGGGVYAGGAQRSKALDPWVSQVECKYVILAI